VRRAQSTCALVVFLAGMWLILPTRPDAQQMIRLGHVGTPGSVFDVVAGEYAKRVNEQLKGKVEVRVFPASQLGTDEQMINGIKLGAPEMFIPSGVMSTIEEKLDVFELPYLIVSRAHMKKVADSDEVKKLLFGNLPTRGMRVLAFWEHGFRHITSNLRPIVKPEDLKGIRVRVPGGEWRMKMFSAYGAQPSLLAFAELYSALQSGTVDAQENPLSLIHAAKLHEVQKYLSLSGHVYAPAYLVVNETFWQKLPADQRDVLEKVAVEMGDVARATGERLDKELLDKMTASSKIKVNEVDQEAFIKAAARMHAEFGKSVTGGAPLVKLIQSLRW
jgi:tripartite ATP-independent transporter DctP family solute receptor